MVKIRVIASGRDKDKWLAEGVNHFLKLLGRYAAIEIKNLSSPRYPDSLSPVDIKKKEAARFEKEFKGGYFIALSDRGQKKDSLEFAGLLERVQVQNRGPINFLIGGPYGLDESILRKADLVLSLSELTFSHQLVRLVLLEQLYRGFSILHGSSYHK
ncbi:MAG: 23S rRNA (pseudouridine(1915)-N(3))-methyltransferase RlmH [candidate division Zixibacteria bacterium]|nr:23S rRNA (pseudouridine(1915)-N(3))-methyltransferase RlmH [candidate division Zixibacteria bacterium]